MRAIVLPAYGGPAVLQMRDIPTPEAGVGQVLIRVHASGVNPVDAKLRAEGSWAGLQLPAVLGHEASGVVAGVGMGVTDFSIGDEVYVKLGVFEFCRGTDAEYVAVPASIVARKPRNLTHEEAASVPLAGGTAWEAVVRRLALRPGETILIHGGAGGVGSFAVQMARACGARVLATAGPGNQDTLRELGVDVPIDYTREDPANVSLAETDGVGVDAVFDTVGDDNLARSLPGVRPFGRGAHILTPAGSLTLAYVKNLTLHGVFVHDDRARLDEMRAVIERGLVKPLLDQVLPLEEAARAHARLDTGHGRGKVVLKVA